MKTFFLSKKTEALFFFGGGALLFYNMLRYLLFKFGLIIFRFPHFEIGMYLAVYFFLIASVYLGFKKTNTPLKERGGNIHFWLTFISVFLFFLIIDSDIIYHFDVWYTSKFHPLSGSNVTFLPDTPFYMIPVIVFAIAQLIFIFNLSQGVYSYFRKSR